MPASDLMISGQVSFFGQYVALIVAEHLEQAQLAAATLRVTYELTEQPRTELVAGLDRAAPPKSGKAKAQPHDVARGTATPKPHADAPLVIFTKMRFTPARRWIGASSSPAW